MNVDATPVIITPDYLLPEQTGTLLIAATVCVAIIIVCILLIIMRNRLIRIFHLLKIKHQLTKNQIKPRQAAYAISKITASMPVNSAAPLSDASRELLNHARYRKENPDIRHQLVSIINQLINYTFTGRH